MINFNFLKNRTMKIRLLIITVFILLAQTGWSSDQKEKKNEEKNQGVPPNTADGIVYALPRTGLSITVKLVKESFRPGPYSLYAEKYLGYSNVNVTASDTWKIVGVQLQSFGEADPEAVYKTFGPVSSMVSLLPDGTIAGVNSGILTERDVLKGSVFIDNSEIPEILFPDQSSDDQYDIEIFSETGEERVMVKSNEIKAREAADYLVRLRKKRAYTILNPSDGVPEDGKGYEVFVQQVEKLEKEYVSLFLGKSFKSEHEFTFNYIPAKENVKNEVLFRFSEEKGILPKTDISGKPITIEMVKDQKQYSSIESVNQPAGPNSGRSGLFYRIPVNASVSISEGINVLYAGRVSIAQFGLITPIPEMLIREDCSLNFDPVTGSLKSALTK
jgi:hypothetical protein